MPTDSELAVLEVEIANSLAIPQGAGHVGFTEAVQQRIDAFALALRSGIDSAALVEIPQKLRHVFLPGLYVRELSLPRGTIVVTKIHKTEHPYIVSQGKVRVFIEGIGWQTVQAPHLGITKPMTRRVCLIVEDCVWTTVHATDKKTPDDVLDDIIFPRTMKKEEL